MADTLPTVEVCADQRRVLARLPMTVAHDEVPHV